MSGTSIARQHNTMKRCLDVRTQSQFDDPTHASCLSGSFYYRNTTCQPSGKYSCVKKAAHQQFDFSFLERKIVWEYLRHSLYIYLKKYFFFFLLMILSPVQYDSHHKKNRICIQQIHIRRRFFKIFMLNEN